MPPAVPQVIQLVTLGVQESVRDAPSGASAALVSVRSCRFYS